MNNTDHKVTAYIDQGCCRSFYDNDIQGGH